MIHDFFQVIRKQGRPGFEIWAPFLGGSPRGVMAQVLDCDHEVTEFELQGKTMNPLIPTKMG